MKFLIFWQDVPERARIYSLNVTEREQIEKINLCHNNYINACAQSEEVESALDWLNQELDSRTAIYDSQNKGNALWADGTIVVTGFLC